MADLEQQEHLERLTRFFPERLPAINEEDCRAANLEMVLLRQLQSVRHDYGGIQLDGAETAARCIHRAICDQHDHSS
jgi:hypothetical protein